MVSFSDSESISNSLGSPAEFFSPSQVNIPADTPHNSPDTMATETVISNSPDDLTMSFSDPSEDLTSFSDPPEIPFALQLDSPFDCASPLNTSTTQSLSSSVMDPPMAIPVEPYSSKAMDILKTAGWDFDVENTTTFSSPVSLCSVSHTPSITTTANGKGRHRS